MPTIIGLARGGYIVPGAVRQTVAKKLQCQILPCWSLFSIVHHNNRKLFQVAFFCLLVVSVFGLIVYDGNFINDDPPFHVLQSWIVPTCHHIKTRLIRYFGKIDYLPTTEKFNLVSRSPPHSPQKFILKP